MQKPIGGRSKLRPAEKRVGAGVGKTIGTYQWVKFSRQFPQPKPPGKTRKLIIHNKNSNLYNTQTPQHFYLHPQLKLKKLYSLEERT
jgi:hypothetical protein